MANQAAAPAGASGTRIVVQQRSGCATRVILFVALVVSVWFNVAQYQRLDRAGLAGKELEVGERTHSGDEDAEQKVAVISVTGTILDGDGFAKQQIDRVREDDQVKAVVLRIDSPGGTVTGSDYLYHHLRELVAERELPMVVSMGSVAASGGYYVAMAAGDAEDVIYAEPTSWIGSIGVIIPHFDLTGLLESWHIEDDSIRSHPLKQLGSPTRPMSEEEREILSGLVEHSYERFKDVVRTGRPELAADEELFAEVTTGEVFSTARAIELKLVDREGFLDDAIARAIELAGLDADEVRTVTYESFGGLFSPLFASQRSPTWSLADAIDLSTPRAYYLFTRFPDVRSARSP